MCITFNLPVAKTKNVKKFHSGGLWWRQAPTSQPWDQSVWPGLPCSTTESHLNRNLSLEDVCRVRPQHQAEAVWGVLVMTSRLKNLFK